MQLITSEVLAGASDKQRLSGVIMCSGYSTQLTKNGKEYITGTLLAGETIGFKAWNNSSAFSAFKGSNLTGKVIGITGSFSEYEGVLSITVDTAVIVEGYSEEQFMSVKYNMGAYWNGLTSYFDKSVSEGCSAVAHKILFDNEEYAQRFKLEFAARSHHDNCVNGLLAHTYKVVVGLGWMFNMYPSLLNVKNKEQFKDTVMLGALLHDLGKTKEMHAGVYQVCASVTHRYLGIEMVMPYRGDIVNVIGEENWYNFVSIFLQHHNDFDDKCRTYASRLVFEADYLDAKLTMLTQLLEKPSFSPSGDRIKMDNDWLQI